MVGAWTGIVTPIFQTVLAVLRPVQEIVGAAVQVLVPIFSSIAQAFEAITPVFENVADSMTRFVEEMQPQIQELITAIGQSVGRVAQGGNFIVGNIRRGMEVLGLATQRRQLGRAPRPVGRRPDSTGLGGGQGSFQAIEAQNRRMQEAALRLAGAAQAAEARREEDRQRLQELERMLRTVLGDTPAFRDIVNAIRGQQPVVGL